MEANLQGQHNQQFLPPALHTPDQLCIQPGQGPCPSISDLFNVLPQKVSTSPPPCLLFYEMLTLPLHLFLCLLKIQADEGGDAKEART